MKKLVALFSCLVMLLSWTAIANADNTYEVGTPENPTKIRIEVWDRGNIPEGKGTVTDNRWTRYLHDEALKAGFDLEWVACPRSQEVEKLNAWMATGSAPDMCLTWDPNLFKSYASQGGIWELDEFISQFGPAITESVGYLLPQMSWNGKVYALCGTQPHPSEAPIKIRRDWLEALGMEVPETIDELTEVLRAFKEKDS